MEKEASIGVAHAASMTAVLCGAVSTAQPTESAQLPYAVIIPQRRPKQRDRGFIRAYAPDLMRCGIDQATFLSFLDGFNATIASSPWVGVVDLTGGAVGAIPASVTAVAPITGTAIQVVTGIYEEISARKRHISFVCLCQNAYLQKMNDQLFRPRGLYCLIMAYNTKSYKNVSHQQQDSTTDFSAMVPGASDTQQQGTSHNIRSNDGVTGDANFPPSAELVFPDPNETLPDSDDSDGSDDDSDREESKANGSGSGFLGKLGKFAADMNAKRDIRSQVKYVSWYSPGHMCGHTASVAAVVLTSLPTRQQKKNPTSGINTLMDPKAKLSEKDLRKQEKREGKQDRKRDKAERKAEKRQRKHPDRSPKKPKVKAGILYLMIVNMPSGSDMNNAQRLVGDSMGDV
ncbi:hypothetical protein ONZ45_g547 [Pleurotus djamor]|nr:hypothetical protein ONZ45_g547 [Pleurotus djamor]